MLIHFIIINNYIIYKSWTENSVQSVSSLNSNAKSELIVFKFGHMTFGTTKVVFKDIYGTSCLQRWT